MDSSRTTPEATKAPDDPAQRSARQMFRYATWVHVGPGAETCEDIDEEQGKNDCANPLHWHGWIRLPNQYQQREIREKALAARARRVRQLRDEESDAYAVLEHELDELRHGGEAAKEQVVDELLRKDMWRDVREAADDVKQGDGDEESPYAHIERDRERLNELTVKKADLPDNEALPDGELDELDSLTRHLDKYDEAFEAAYQARIKPRRESLMAQSLDELVDQIRDDRINADAEDAFMHVYSTYMKLAGTLKKPRGEHVWKDIAPMKESAPEVIEDLDAAFQDLERAHAKEQMDARAEGPTSRESRG